MDKNSSGTLDWWEFLNAEAVKKLAKRDKVGNYMFWLSFYKYYCSNVNDKRYDCYSVNWCNSHFIRRPCYLCWQIVKLNVHEMHFKLLTWIKTELLPLLKLRELSRIGFLSYWESIIGINTCIQYHTVPDNINESFFYQSCLIIDFIT